MDWAMSPELSHSAFNLTSRGKIILSLEASKGDRDPALGDGAAAHPALNEDYKMGHVAAYLHAFLSSFCNTIIEQASPTAPSYRSSPTFSSLFSHNTALARSTTLSLQHTPFHLAVPSPSPTKYTLPPSKRYRKTTLLLQRPLLSSTQPVSDYPEQRRQRCPRQRPCF